MKYNKIYAIPEDMYENIWSLYLLKNKFWFNWSYVDCSSFIFIRDIRKAKYKNKVEFINVLSFDNHFVEAQEEYRFKLYPLPEL